MQITLIVVLSIIGIALLALVLFILLRKGKKVPATIVRAQNVLVKVNQKIYAVNREIDKVDKKINKLVMIQEKKDLSLMPSIQSLDELKSLLEQEKERIEKLMGQLMDLKQFKESITTLLKAKKEEELQELERLLDDIAEKLKQVY